MLVVAVRPRLLQHLQVPAPSGICAGPHVPLAAVRPRPLQHLQVPAPSGISAGRSMSSTRSRAPAPTAAPPGAHPQPPSRRLYCSAAQTVSVSHLSHSSPRLLNHRTAASTLGPVYVTRSTVCEPRDQSRNSEPVIHPDDPSWMWTLTDDDRRRSSHSPFKLTRHVERRIPTKPFQTLMSHDTK